MAQFLTPPILIIGLVVLFILEQIGETLWSWYKWTLPGTLSVEFLTNTGDIYRTRVRALEAEGGVERFEWRGKSYNAPQGEKAPRYRRRVSMFGTAIHCYYVEGRTDPINILDPARSGNTSDELDLLGLQHIISDTLRELAKEIFSPLMLTAIVCVVVLVAAFALYHFISGDINKLSQILASYTGTALQGAGGTGTVTGGS